MSSIFNGDVEQSRGGGGVPLASRDTIWDTILNDIPNGIVILDARMRTLTVSETPECLGGGSHLTPKWDPPRQSGVSDYRPVLYI